MEDPPPMSRCSSQPSCLTRDLTPLHAPLNSEQLYKVGKARRDAELAPHRQQRAKDQAVTGLLAGGIRQNRFCKLLNEEKIDAIVQTMQCYRFKEGETVIKQGAVGYYFFVVETGTLNVFLNGQLKDTLGGGEAFGGLALVYNGTRNATIVAKEQSDLWGAAGDVFREVVQEHAIKVAEQNRSFIDSIAFFKNLPGRKKAQIGSIPMYDEVFEAGDLVVREGAVPLAFHIVRTGRLRALVGSVPDGTVVRQYAPGDCIGERAVLYGAYRSSVVAGEKTELVSIRFQSLKEVLGNDFITCLKHHYIFSLLNKLQIIECLSTMQVNRIVEAMEVKFYKPNVVICEGVVLIIVVMDGEVSGVNKGTPCTLKNGQWLFHDALIQLEVAWPVSPTETRCGLEDIRVGADGAKLAMLSGGSLAKVLQDLGVAAAGSPEEAIDYLWKLFLAKHVPILRDLSEEQLNSVVGSLQLRRCTRGTQVIGQSELESDFFIVASGEAAVVANGKELRTLTRGTCFGERALLFNEEHTVSVEIKSDEAELWFISQQRFKELMSEGMWAELEHRIGLQDEVMTLKNLRHIRHIGCGSFGSVRLVEHKQTGLRYALKRIRKDAGEIPIEVEREVAILAETEHPFVLHLVTTFETEKNVYLLTELITGGQLFEQTHVKIGNFSRKHAQFYVGTLVLILESVHALGIVHRDLKLENVMLDAHGYLKLVDFGVAKKLDPVTPRTFTVTGTILYMAPEIMVGKGYGTEVDIWALGVVLYELVCGGVPFGEDTDDPQEIIASIQEQELSFPSTYNDLAGKKLMQGMLSRKIEQRLGAGMNGWEDVKNNKFFKAGVSGSLFNQIMGREIRPPIVPEGEHWRPEVELEHECTNSDAGELACEDEERKRSVTRDLAVYDSRTLHRRGSKLAN